MLYRSLTGADDETDRLTKNVFATLDAALTRCSRMLVDSMQAAVFHRRVLLLSGASNEQDCLFAPTCLGVTNAFRAVDQKNGKSETCRRRKTYMARDNNRSSPAMTTISPSTRKALPPRKLYKSVSHANWSPTP